MYVSNANWSHSDRVSSCRPTNTPLSLDMLVTDVSVATNDLMVTDWSSCTIGVCFPARRDGPLSGVGCLGIHGRIQCGDVEGMLAVSIWWNALIEVQSARDRNNV